MGHGPQETFVNCADIRITKNGGPAPTPPPPVPTDAPMPPTPAPPTPAPPAGKCQAVGAWAGNANMDAWCNSNCAIGNCPSSMCKCN